MVAARRSRDGDPDLIAEVSWPLFAAVQLWFVAALTLYIAFAELDDYFGPGSFRRALVRRTPKREPDRPEATV